MIFKIRVTDGESPRTHTCIYIYMLNKNKCPNSVPLAITMGQKCEWFALFLQLCLARKIGQNMFETFLPSHLPALVAHPLQSLCRTERCHTTLSHSVSTSSSVSPGCSAKLLRTGSSHPNSCEKGGSVTNKSALVQWHTTQKCCSYTVAWHPTLVH